MRYWLRNLRVENKLSQQELADLLGISQNYYCLIETGDRLSSLRLNMASQLSDLFGVSLDYIRAEEDKISARN